MYCFPYRERNQEPTLNARVDSELQKENAALQRTGERRGSSQSEIFVGVGVVDRSARDRVSH